MKLNNNQQFIDIIYFILTRKTLVSYKVSNKVIVYG